MFEVLAVLRREVGRGSLAEERAAAAVTDLGSLGVELFPSMRLRARAWELRQNATVGDALFLALAQLLAEPLATKDARLARGAEGLAGVSLQLLSG